MDAVSQGGKGLTGWMLGRSIEFDLSQEGQVSFLNVLFRSSPFLSSAPVHVITPDSWHDFSQTDCEVLSGIGGNLYKRD